MSNRPRRVKGREGRAGDQPEPLTDMTNEDPTSYAEAQYVTRGVNGERLNAITKHAGESVLDVGCGSGAYVLRLADEYEITGVDFRHYETWEARPELFSVSDASVLERADNSVDTILCFETLEHLPEPEKALREYHRVCRKNIILTVPNCDLTPGMDRSRLIYYHWIDRTHVNFFNMRTITETMEQSGFAVVESYYINRISVLPLFEEAFDVSGFAGRMAYKFLAGRQRREYPMTCLVVGKKR